MKYLVLGLLCGAVLSCAGAGPGDSDTLPAAPAPPLEIPSFLRFPTDIGIDVQTIQSDQSPAVNAFHLLVGAQGPFSTAISSGADTAAFSYDIVSGIAEFLNGFEIPVSEEVTTVTAPFSPDFDDGLLVKIDFADFDFDGDGLSEGCSGHTGAIPICYRIWLVDENTPSEGDRFMNGVFDSFPVPDDADTDEDESDPGDGRFTIGRGDIDNVGVFIGATYTFSDPARKRSELYLLGPGAFTPGVTQGSHIIVEQQGDDVAPVLNANPDQLALKTVRVTETERPFSGGDFTFIQQYVGQYREGLDFWSGSVEFPEEDISLRDTCANIPSGAAANQANCIDAKIRVGDTPFIDPATLDDARFSSDFPEEPTF